MHNIHQLDTVTAVDTHLDTCSASTQVRLTGFIVSHCSRHFAALSPRVAIGIPWRALYCYGLPGPERFTRLTALQTCHYLYYYYFKHVIVLVPLSIWNPLLPDFISYCFYQHLHGCQQKPVTYYRFHAHAYTTGWMEGCSRCVYISGVLVCLRAFCTNGRKCNITDSRPAGDIRHPGLRSPSRDHFIDSCIYEHLAAFNIT